MTNSEENSMEMKKVKDGINVINKKQENEESEGHEVNESENTANVRKPDGAWGWCVCFGAFICNFVVFGTHNSFGVIYNTLIKELDISSAETAWIGSIAMGLNFLFGPVASALCERIGCQMTTLIGATLSVAGLLLSSFIARDDVSKMYATYGVMWGTGSSMCYVPSMVILGQYFDERMALANGLGTSGSGVGTVVMAPVIQKLLTTVGWRATFRIVGVVAILLFVSAWLFRPLKGLQKENKETAHPCVDLNIWRNKAFIVWVLAISFFLFGYFIPYVHLVRLASLHGVESKDAAWLIAFLSIASTVGRVVFGKLGDLKRVNRLYMFQLSILIIGATTALLSQATNYALLLAYAITFGFFDGCFVGQVAVVTSSIVGMKHLAVALGYLFGSIAIPMTMGPPMAGWIYDAWQSYDLAFYVAGGTSFLGFLTMFLIPRLVKKHSEAWERLFENKRRASIESRRKLLSDLPQDTNVLSTSDGNGNVPALAQVTVERANYTRGRRRSLPAIHMSPYHNATTNKNQVSSPSTPNSLTPEKTFIYPCHFPNLPSGSNSNTAPNSSTGFSSNICPRGNRARRGSLPAIAFKPSSVSQREGKATQLLLVDANLLAQHGISLVNTSQQGISLVTSQDGEPSTNRAHKANTYRRRGSLPAINHSSLPNSLTTMRSNQGKLYNGVRRGSLPAVSLTTQGDTHHDRSNKAKNSLLLSSFTENSGNQSLDEKEEEQLSSTPTDANLPNHQAKE